MAVQITSENFDEYFKSAMNTYGKAVENEQDVPTVEASEVAESEDYSLPLVKNDSGEVSYAKVDIPDFMQEIADKVETEGMLQAITQAQFDAIFDIDSSSSSD